MALEQLCSAAHQTRLDSRHRRFQDDTNVAQAMALDIVEVDHDGALWFDGAQGPPQLIEFRLNRIVLTPIERCELFEIDRIVNHEPTLLVPPPELGECDLRGQRRSPTLEVAGPRKLMQKDSLDDLLEALLNEIAVLLL